MMLTPHRHGMLLADSAPEGKESVIVGVQA